MASDLQDAIIVRPLDEPTGLKVYTMEWSREEKKIQVLNLNGELVDTVPGKWSARKQLGEAFGLIGF